jgi:hypothetical protein
MKMDSLQIKAFSLEEMMPLIQEYLKAGQNVRFSPRGISMLPMLRQGVDSVVLTAAPEKLCKYDLPLYQRPDGKYILHRVVSVGETYTCIGDNQFQYETDVGHDWVVAVVTSFYRGDQMWSVQDWRYRLYCRFWHYSRPMRHFWHRGIRWLRRHLKR